MLNVFASGVYAVIHDCDGHFYLRAHEGAYLAGGFEPRSKPADLSIIPSGELGTLPEDWDQFCKLFALMPLATVIWPFTDLNLH